MSYESEPYISLQGPPHPYNEGKRIPRTSITVQHPRIALVPVSSAYSHPGEKYDRTLWQRPLAARGTYLPSTVNEFVQNTDQYLDPRRFTAIPNYSREKKNARETSWNNRWLHIPGDVQPVARCRAHIHPDMPYVKCEKEEVYQWHVNKLFSDLYVLHGDPWSEFPLSDYNLLGLLCFKLPYEQLYWITNKYFWNNMIEPDGRIRTSLKYVLCWHQV